MASDTRPLWEEIFSEDSAAFLDYYYKEKTRDNWIQTDNENGELISMIHWNPYPLRIRGQRVDSRYLIAVATKKEYQHQGRMARLLKEGLHHYAAQGVPFVWLMPADPAIYTPFSFRYIYDKIEGNWPISLGEEAATLDFGESRQQEEPCNLQVQILSPEEYPGAAIFLEEELSRRYDAFTVRTSEYLRVLEAETASEGGHVMAIYDRRKLVGVFSYWLGESVEIRELVVKEAYESGHRKEALLQAVNAYLAPYGLPITAITTGWLGTPKPIIMARLVSLKHLMPLFSADEPLTLCLKVTDSILPENEGTFLWELDPKGAQWERTDNMQQSDYEFSIAELTEWLFGEISTDYPQIQTLKRTFFNEIV